MQRLRLKDQAHNSFSTVDLTHEHLNNSTPLQLMNSNTSIQHDATATPMNYNQRPTSSMLLLTFGQKQRQTAKCGSNRHVLGTT